MFAFAHLGRHTFAMLTFSANGNACGAGYIFAITLCKKKLNIL